MKNWAKAENRKNTGEGFIRGKALSLARFIVGGMSDERSKTLEEALSYVVALLPLRLDLTEEEKRILRRFKTKLTPYKETSDE